MDKILVVDDESKVCQFLVDILSRQGYRVEGVNSSKQALEMLKHDSYDLLLTDLMMPEMNGLQLLERAKEEDPDLAVVMITGYSTVETAVEAMKKGALDYLAKPFKIEEIKIVVEKALQHKSLMAENRRLRQELKNAKGGLPLIIGASPAMQRIYRIIDKVANTDSTVLIRGENGTGKELVARTLHLKSGRSSKAYVSINCAALPENLLESELFGHARGSFTGAVQAKKGLFEEADGGTIFLDEIGDISPGLQVKLLRVLQEQEFLRVGETRVRKINVRVLAATNRDLEAAIAQGSFRPELFYRLNVISIIMPPLREREGDLPLLAEHFLQKYCQKIGRPKLSLSPAAVKVLCDYSWPGNVRELENIIERIVILAEGDIIRPEELPRELHSCKIGAAGATLFTGGFQQQVAQFQRHLILQALAEVGGVQSRAAQLLGLKKTTLNEMMKRLDLYRQD
ncbi:MAG: sigma-54-dependent transcriptional regulator [Bacillota bacterium]